MARLKHSERLSPEISLNAVFVPEAKQFLLTGSSTRSKCNPSLLANAVTFSKIRETGMNLFNHSFDLINAYLATNGNL